MEFDPHQAWELLLEKKYDRPVQEVVPDPVSLIQELQNDVEALKRDRDKVFKWAEGFGLKDSGGGIRAEGSGRS